MFMLSLFLFVRRNESESTSQVSFFVSRVSQMSRMMKSVLSGAFLCLFVVLSDLPPLATNIPLAAVPIDIFIRIAICCVAIVIGSLIGFVTGGVAELWHAIFG